MTTLKEAEIAYYLAGKLTVSYHVTKTSWIKYAEIIFEILKSHSGLAFPLLAFGGVLVEFGAKYIAHK